MNLAILLFLIGFSSSCYCELLSDDRPKSLKILVLGRTGTGKSTLVNNIFGVDIAKASGGLEPGTLSVNIHKESIYGVDVTVCDTPGLQDARRKEENYMKEVDLMCSDADLVLVCFRMDGRWQDDDVNTIEVITEHLGTGLWNNAVIVLTHADKIDYPKIEEKKEHLAENKKQWTDKLDEALSKAGVETHDMRVQMSARDKSTILPGECYWLSSLFLACLRKSKAAGTDGLEKIIHERISNSAKEDIPISEKLLCKLLNM